VTRNGLGQIDTKTEVVGASTTGYVYTYTDAGQLDTVTKDSTLVEDYAYDIQGRRTGDLAGRVYAYDDEDHLNSWSDGTTTAVYTYDVDGFLTQRDVDTTGDLIPDDTTVSLGVKSCNHAFWLIGSGAAPRGGVLGGGARGRWWRR
jgi:hypothetical protein